MPAKRLKTCERGHKFYKRSDYTFCPICAAQDKPKIRKPLPDSGMRLAHQERPSC